MPRACSICSHPEQAMIARDLADCVSYRAIAEAYGVSKSALVRHTQHASPQAAHVPGHAQPPAPAPCTCPCTRIPWDELAHDAQQLGTYLQKAQPTDDTVYYMKFYLLRFAALIASADAQSRTA